MAESDPIQFACIGCGTLNPPGAEVCAGCGHRFAGTIGESIPGPSPIPAPAPYRPRGPYRPRKRPDEMTFAGCLLRVFGLIVATIAGAVAFVIAFFLTCSAAMSNGSGATVLLLSLLAGLGAIGVVVVLSFWVASWFRNDRDGTGRDGRKWG